MNMRANLNVTIFMLLFFCYCCLSCFSDAVAAAPVDLDKIVAVVNKDVITQSELDKRIALLQKQLGKNEFAEGKETKPAVSRQQILDSLIDVSLQLQLAKRAGIHLSEKELDDAIADIAKDNNITLDQLKQTVVERDGINYNNFRNQIREQILIKRTQQQFLAREITVDNKEVEEFLHNPPKIDLPPAQYHIVDVLFEIPDNFTKEQQDQVATVAKQMATKLSKGISVEDVVREGQQKFKVKEQIVSSSDLGWRKFDEMPTLFASEVKQLGVNQVAGPLQAPNGLHLVKLLGINGVPLQAAKFTFEQAYRVVLQRKLVAKVRAWLKEQRVAAYIKIYR